MNNQISKIINTKRRLIDLRSANKNNRYISDLLSKLIATAAMGDVGKTQVYLAEIAKTDIGKDIKDISHADLIMAYQNQGQYAEKKVRDLQEPQEKTEKKVVEKKVPLSGWLPEWNKDDIDSERIGDQDTIGDGDEIWEKESDEEPAEQNIIGQEDLVPEMNAEGSPQGNLAAYSTPPAAAHQEKPSLPNQSSQEQEPSVSSAPTTTARQESNQSTQGPPAASNQIGRPNLNDRLNNLARRRLPHLRKRGNGELEAAKKAFKVIRKARLASMFFTNPVLMAIGLIILFVIMFALVGDAPPTSSTTSITSP